MSVEYQGTMYDSKAEVCRLMYDNGEVKMDAASKKAAATFLGMTVQTVHATLKKYLENKGELPKSSTTRSRSRDNDSLDKPKAIRLKDSKEEVNDEGMSKDDGDGYTKYNRPKKGQIFITSAPNRYGLPVTNPPIEIRTNEYDD